MIRPFLVAAHVSAPLVDVWTPVLQRAADRFAINNRLRRIHWLATLIHECAGFTRLQEDLRYRAATLLRLFPLSPGRPWGFTAQDAADYAMRPEAIANRIYADRMGNGNEASGEGWFYRGRGPGMITGRTNYGVESGPVGHDLLAKPDFMLVPEYGSIAAAHFWQSRHCNEKADADDVVAIRHTYNGGEIGLKEVALFVDLMKGV